MPNRNKKNRNRVNLLSLSDIEKIKAIKAIRETLRQKAVEAKLWQSFIEADNVSINGQEIWCSEISLKGIRISELTKSV